MKKTEEVAVPDRTFSVDDTTKSLGHTLTARWEANALPDQRYELIKTWLQALGYGTAQQVHDAMDQPNPYSQREVENALEDLVAKEPEEFEKVDVVYRSRKHYRSARR